MSYSLAQARAKKLQVGTYDTSIFDSFASTPSVGDIIVVTGGGGSQASTYSVSDNQGNTYTVYQTNNVNNYSGYVAWARAATSSGTFTVTATQAGQQDNVIQISAYSGGLASGTLDQYTIGTQVSDTPVAVSLGANTAVAGELLVGMFISQGSSTTAITTPSGYTSTLAANNTSDALTKCGIGGAYKVAGATGAETITWPTYPASVGLAGILLALKPAASGPTVTGITQSTPGTESGNIVFTVSLSGATSGTTNYAASFSGTATSADYNSNLATVTYSNGVTFSAGNMVVPNGVSGWTVTTAITPDTLNEANETVILTVGGVASATSTIIDDDPLPGYSISDGTQVGNAVNHTVTLNAPSGRTVTIQIDTANGSKIAGTHYTAIVAQTVTFTPGVTSQPISVTVL